MTEPTAPRRGNPAGLASLIAGALLLLMSAAGQVLYPLVPLLARELAVPFGVIPLLVSIPAAIIAVVATVCGIVGLLLRDRSRTPAIIGSTLGASHLALGLAGVIGAQLGPLLY